MADKKVVVIGLDGATWDLIKPWADEGELPTFKKLMKNGVWGILESTIPPVTGPAWASFATGKNPGKHSIFDFVRLENNYLKLNRSSDIRSETIYEILSKKGFKNIIIGLPLSYPSRRHFKGIMISDFLYPVKEIFPASKEEYIREYKVAPELTKTGEDLLEDMIKTAESQVRVAKKMFIKESWDFYFFLFPETDSVSHHFWKDIISCTKIGEKAKEIFYIADDFLGWLLTQIDKRTVLFIMSDHGFANYPYVLNLNRILMNRGFLKLTITEKKTNNPFHRHIIETFGERREKKELNLPVTLLNIASHPVIKPLSRIIFRLLFKDRELKYVKGIDFESSKAFVPTSESMSIYINRKINGEERKCIINNLIILLRDLRYDGRKVFKQILRREEIYSGTYVEFAPDILLIPDGFYITSGFSSKIFGDFRMGAFHDLRGIFLAYGSGIKKSYRMEGAKIYDIAPTILHIFGLPIPKDMDGRVLKEIFEEDSEFAKREIKYQEVDEKGKISEKIKELKALGKI